MVQFQMNPAPSPAEHGEFARRCPVLFGPGKNASSHPARAATRPLGATTSSPDHTCPVIEELARVELGNIGLNGNPVSGCFDQFQLGFARCHVEKPPRRSYFD